MHYFYIKDYIYKRVIGPGVLIQVNVFVHLVPMSAKNDMAWNAHYTTQLRMNEMRERGN
jgi:hypothetical protein